MASAYIFAHHLGRFSKKTRTAFASFSGGVAAAYVFLFILPKLASQQAILETYTFEWPLTDYLYHHAYIAALAGFTTYYLTGMFTFINRSNDAFDFKAKLGILMLVLYAATLGELASLQEQQSGFLSLLLTFALAIHLFGLNYLLSDHLGNMWKWLRWLLVASLFAGWLVGDLFSASLGISALLSAWIAGSIIIHVVMIELPETRSPFSFVAGIFVFALLLKMYLKMGGIDGGI